MPIKLQVDQLSWLISYKSTLKNLFFAKRKRGFISPYIAGKTSSLYCITHQQKNILVAALNGYIYLKNKIVNHCHINPLTQHFPLVLQESVVSFSLTYINIFKVDLLTHKGVFALAMPVNDFNKLSNCERQSSLVACTLVEKTELPMNNITQYLKNDISYLL
jgi:ABC-type cobalamin/Fe3+-siderophores transport system ATPase subunit